MSRKLTFSFASPTGVLAESPAGVGNGIFAEGPTLPTDATAGYQEGCLFFLRSAGAGVTGLYKNEGTNSSCAFKRVLSLTDVGGATLSGLTATAAEINRNNAAASRLVASGASLAVTQALHDGKTVVLAAAAAVTLPAMTGSGSRFRFVCPQDSTAVTITATAANLFGGVTVGTDSAFAAGTLFTVGFAANGGGATVITFDGSTRGGKKGDWVEVEDVAAGVGIVRGMLNGSGTEATPFS